MADEKPVPEWAMNAARSCAGKSYDDIARILVKVREDALREAARLSRGPFAKAIYALIDKDPGS